MEKQIAMFTNRGMYQDVSVSKATNEFAYENYNIRITALDDHTLLSVTNEKQPSLEHTIEGLYLGHAVLGDTIVLFTVVEGSVKPDRIYTLTYEEEDNLIESYVLYEGKLNFNINNPIETLAYYESNKVQKVYWVDGLNQPRVVNIKGPIKEYDTPVKDEEEIPEDIVPFALPGITLRPGLVFNGIDTQFDFNPKVGNVPYVTITKEYTGNGLFPAGVIQYFITYYSKFDSETNIVWASDLNYINDVNRGSSPEDTISCTFKLDISNLDKNFTHIRVYSIKRTSINGTPQASIVKDINIENQESCTIIDDNKNQESIDPTMLFFLGGKDFIASTITQKDDTLFLGNIKDNTSIPSVELKEALTSTIIDSDGIKKSTLVSFNTKAIETDSPKGYYSYNRQTLNGSLSFKTFKKGEIYRFAVQFQTATGSWTTPVWIGDLKCNIAPVYDESSGCINVANAKCELTSEITNLCKDYINYKLLIADTSTEHSVVAQGVVCPTVFNYEDRIEDKTYAQASWIMRPRGGNTAWRHMEYTAPEIQGTNELEPSSSKEIEDIWDAIKIYLRPYSGHSCVLALRGYNSTTEESYLQYNTLIDNGSWNATYEKLNELVALKTPISLNDITNFDKFKKFAKRELSEASEAQLLGSNWEDAPFTEYSLLTGYNNDRLGRGFACYTVQLKDYSSEKLQEDPDYQEKKNNYYVDNTILTFHSPDIENNESIFNGGNLKFRLVGYTPITSSYSDAEINLKNKGLSSAYNVNKSSIKNVENISKESATLVYKPLYKDSGWLVEHSEDIPTYYRPSLQLVDYPIHMWHKQGSIVGFNEKTFNTDKTQMDSVPAELKDKTFGTQRFSYDTKYFNTYWSSKITKTQYVGDNTKDLIGINLPDNYTVFYSGNNDKLLAFTEPYNVGDIEQQDPVRVKYNSTSHVVFGLLNNDRTKLKSLPTLNSESEAYSEIYNTKTTPIFAWEYSKLNPVMSKIKSLGVYKDNGTDFNNNNDFNNWWNNIVRCYLGEENMNNILHSDTSNVFYIFITSSNYVDTIYKVIKLTTKGSILTVTNREVGTLADFAEELLGKSFNVAQYTDYVPLSDGWEAFGFTKEDFKVGTLLTIKKHLIVNNQQTYISVYSSTPLVPDTSTLETVDTDGYPYLYLGELYRDIDYSNLYGGYDDNALELINWLPASSNCGIKGIIELSEGDTYYQRWDCLKTYPSTEEDINKVIDVTSFMVETRRNIESNYSNRIGDFKNLLTVRPSNFTKYNEVYDQPNNFFVYNILDDKYAHMKYDTQVAWSMQKTPNSDVDAWTNISLANVLNLKGEHGSLNKLINYNDTLLAFQDTAISIVNFNNRTALSTESGVPIEIANSYKVDGYRFLTATNGCTSKELIAIGANGLYFIDSYNKGLYLFNSEGIQKLSEQGMSVWFNDNTKGISRIAYNPLTNDLYILQSDKALLYNEKLQAFSTFIDFINTSYKAMFNFKGLPLSFKTTLDNTEVLKLNNGKYHNNYSITYKVNPEPYLDKTFTNIEFIADCYDSPIEGVPNSFGTKADKVHPFNKISIWNEYQYGEVNDTTLNRKYPDYARKFRIRRVDLPRDKSNGRDRIRNPWAMLKLLNDNQHDLHMVFHNLNVIYYR